MSDALRQAYDETPYPCTPYPQTHPARLAVIAKIHGLQPTPVDSCRVLELGCADGSNLVPMAARLPTTQFVGVDLSPRQIERGRAVIDELKLPNIDLRAEDLTRLPPDLGPFDYIIAHGLYSWIPEPTQQALLDLVRQRLSPNGVAFISYNTFPGWHLRGALREWVSRRWRGEPELSTADRLADTRRVLTHLHEAARATPWPFAQVIAGELDAILPQEDAYIAHDLLECEQHPITFRDFARALDAHGLQYLSDAEWHAALGRGLPAAAHQQIAAIATNEIDRQEWMDLLLHRTFRQSLVVPAEATLSRGWDLSRLLDTWIVGDLELDPEQGAGAYQTARGLRFRETDPLVDSAIGRLRNAFPQSVPMAELVSLDGTGAADGPARIVSAMLRLFSYSAVDLHSAPWSAGGRDLDAPISCPFVRWQSTRQSRVVHRFHDNVDLTEEERSLLIRLDGSLRTADLSAKDRSTLERCARSALLVDHSN